MFKKLFTLCLLLIIVEQIAYGPIVASLELRPAAQHALHNQHSGHEHHHQPPQAKRSCLLMRVCCASLLPTPEALPRPLPVAQDVLPASVFAFQQVVFALFKPPQLSSSALVVV